MKTNLTCSCQDSDGNVCGREMTLQEIKDDGVCHICADNVWEEMRGNNPNFHWKHERN